MEEEGGALLSLLTDDSLKSKLQGFEKYVRSELLRFWQVHEPHFTDHGIYHCESIIDILNRMIPLEIKKHLNEYEIYLLLCSVWLHDIGMIVKKPEESSTEVRKTHHDRGRNFIRTGLEDINLSELEKYIIGEMTFYHRKIEDISKVKEMIEVQHNSKTSKVHLRFLCALLRLGDACEIAHARTSRKFVDISGLDGEAKFYHEAHLHVSGLSFDPITNEIIVYIIVKNEKDGRILKNLFESNLKKELESVKDILRVNGIMYDKIKCDITIDRYARELPSLPVCVDSLSIEEKISEIGKITGYIPSMIIDRKNGIHIFYETISQTRKELQLEIVNFLEEVWKIFKNKNVIILTINKIHNYAGTIGNTDPEILTVESRKEIFDEYFSRIIDKRQLWNRLIFIRKITIDQFHKIKQRTNWSLAI